MSVTPDIQELLEELYSAKRSIVQARYAMAAMLCLQLYEWLSGIEEEIRLIHRAAWTSIKSLYLLCRYYPLLLWGVVMWAYVGDHTFEACSRVVHPIHALLGPCQFFSQAVMLMRAFAFCGRDKRVLVLLGSCYTCLLVLDIWVFCTKVDVLPKELYVVINGVGCFPNYGAGFMALRIGYSMLAAILMDLLSLVVIVVHCVRSKWDRDVSLARYFVHQGFIAFAFITLVNIATAISFFKPPRYHTGLGLPLILVVSNVVACRIILQLRKQVTPSDAEISRRNSSIVRRAMGASELPHIQNQDSWTISRA
ncbi:hypothetical protein CPC08DRAFT_705888 [Agrocybe pediades]|nr:hypothetical protein CPC08DRAFT_705888 [Agrocybe pediades]